ncbi:hypothetical protein M0E87_10040 [Corynebacterium sp. CCM 9185]|uniref:Uncharacterized protein n=1 Tax=Corynebacterium marambiense TaxID=2765364 RepID=A0ABS0VXK5_9CORY|nr:hypothetical protein [Corynebacterium marambiense]MBI9001479.1 hypothetical protein [Corynebacterium marambiense]MCK7663997.1 hypothetical protein [Corynebacterium marambiense]MCX7543332.1 hypothetical protein [Corynebacterium marambiense]
MGSQDDANASEQGISRRIQDGDNSGEAGPVTATETTTLTATKQITPPVGSTRCRTSGGWDVFAATERTSCPFSVTVGEQLRAGRAGPGWETRTSLLVYSPVTEKNYVVVCGSSGGENYDCATTTDARVILIKR